MTEEIDPCPSCGETGELSGKHYRGVRCNNGSCRVKLYDDHSYSDFTDKIIEVNNYAGFVKNKSHHVWVVEKEDLEPERGNGNSLTAVLQRLTGKKIKTTIRVLEEAEKNSDTDVFEEERKYFE